MVVAGMAMPRFMAVFHRGVTSAMLMVMVLMMMFFLQDDSPGYSAGVL